MDDTWVYVAGPYTSEPVANTRAAIEVADAIYSKGLGLIPIVPHNNLLWDMIQKHDYEWYIEFDLHLLARCDALLRIPGESPGADGEVEFAKDHGIPVFYDEHELYAWAEVEWAMEHSGLTP